jgi:uncharacterized membrane protein
MRHRDDDGTILVLTLGYLVLALSLVLVVVDISALFLARRGLAADCDGAALAAAQSADATAVYAGTTGVRLPLAQVQAAVERYDPSGELTAALRDGETVVVTGRRTVHLPVVGFLGIHPVTVVAHAAAQSLRRT